jgi:hypothetical protein
VALPLKDKTQPTNKLLKDRLGKAHYQKGDAIRGHTISNGKKVGLEEGFGVLPTSGSMMLTPSLLNSKKGIYQNFITKA